MTNVLKVGRRQAFIWLMLGVVAGYALSLMLGGSNVSAQEQVGTGVEAVRTDVLEANFVPGTGSSSTYVWFRGSGFVPDTEITLLIADSFGVLTDITITADPRNDGGGSVYPLIANDDGAWATEWRIGRFTRAGVGAEGMFTVYVYDKDYNLLATTPLALCNLTDRPEGEEIPNYCSA